MRYLGNAILIAIIIAFALQLSGHDILNIPADSEASSSPLPPGITALSSGQLVQSIIDSPSSNPTLLMLYASWCPHCKSQFPHIEELAFAYSGKMNFIALSIDKNPQALATFLENNAKKRNLKGYIYDVRKISELMQKLNQMGAQFNGGIPFTAIFDKKGKLTAQINGFRKKEIIREEIDKTLRYK